LKGPFRSILKSHHTL